VALDRPVAADQAGGAVLAGSGREAVWPAAAWRTWWWPVRVAGAGGGRFPPIRAFGLGTTAVLAGAGAVIGALIRHQRLPRRLAERVAQEGAGWTLLAGGILFTVAGIAGLIVPSVMTAGISTGIHIHNLDQINAGTLLVILIVVIAVVTITATIRRLRHLPAETAAGCGGGVPDGRRTPAPGPGGPEAEDRSPGGAAAAREKGAGGS